LTVYDTDGMLAFIYDLKRQSYSHWDLNRIYLNLASRIIIEKIGYISAESHLMNT